MPILDECVFFEALKILEAPVIECKTREIDTPEVREALDVLASYCRPEWRVTGFREHLKRLEEPGDSMASTLRRTSSSVSSGKRSDPLSYIDTR